MKKLRLNQRVRVIHSMKFDELYDCGIRSRKCHSNKTGIIVQISNSHGLCYGVKFSCGCVIYYEPDEIKLIKIINRIERRRYGRFSKKDK